MLFSALISCNNHNIKIVINNKTNEAIVDMLVFVQGKQFKVDRIEVNKSYKIQIHKEEVITNNHDFRIESTLTNKKGNANRGFFYSDISNRPNSEYVIEVHNTKTVIK